MTEIISASVRQVQIDLITGNPNVYIERFMGLCENLSIINDDIYHTNGGEYIYYSQTEEWVFYQDQYKDRFWYNYYYWIKGMINGNGISEIEATVITRLLMEDILIQKYKVSTKATARGNIGSGVIAKKMKAMINHPNNKHTVYYQLEDVLIY